MAKVLVVLSGSGVQDGSEIHEAVSTLIHLDQRDAQVTVAAPDRPQAKVVNHATGQAVPGERRNMLVESARIARGNITPLHKMRGSDFDAIVFPGGYGAAVNLCSFAADGAKCTVDPDVRRVLMEAREARKVIGLICIAPAIGAAVFGSDYHPKLTVGNDPATARNINATGAVHCDTGPTDLCVDSENRIVSTPAYMCNTRIRDVYDGIGKLVDRVLAMAAGR